jgi:Flp pilus assembly pilin Flp
MRFSCDHPLVRDQRGLTTVEYAICLCLVAALAVGAWNSFGDHVLGNLQRADTKIDDHLHENEKAPRP